MEVTSIPDLLERASAAIDAEWARRSGSRSFAAFVKQMWPIIDPAPLTWGWHMDAICQHLEAIARGEMTRLIINVPPRHSKSTLFSILWPAWMWIDHPAMRFVFVSYSGTLSTEHSIKCRQVVESPLYRERFKIKWKLRDDQNTQTDFANTAGGRRQATSITGGITGLGGDVICIDDPLNAEDAATSKAAREEANRVITEAISTRLNDPRTGRVALIMQRLHEEDPTGALLEAGGWQHLCLPSEFEESRRSITYVSGSSTSNEVPKEEVQTSGGEKEFWRDPRQEEGELLFPERFPREVIERTKTTLGSARYAGQHQQSPAPADGFMFNRTWWRFWKPEGTNPSLRRPHGCVPHETHPARTLPRPEEFREVVLTVDANFKERKGADPVSIQAIATLGSNRFLLYRTKTLGFNKAVEAIREAVKWLEFREYRVRRILVEAKANGDAIIETLRDELKGVIGIEPHGGKEARAAAIQPQVEAGNCYIPEGAIWAEEFVEQFAVFPRGKHDDDVDAFSQALLELSNVAPSYKSPGSRSPRRM